MAKSHKEYREPETKPVKPITAFFIYFKEQSMGMAEKSTIERSKVLGQRWKELSEKERKRYYNIYEQNMKEYAENIAAWYRSHPEDKVADEEKALSAKQKSKAKHDRKKEKELAMFFAIGHIRKHTLLTGETLTHNEKLVKVLKSRFYMLTDAEKLIWEKFWSKMNPSKQEEVVNLYKKWRGNKN